MSGAHKRRSPGKDEADQAVEAITQAQFMVAIYAEIVAMNVTILARIRQLVVRDSNAGNGTARLSNLRLILVQLERVGERLAFWNRRMQALAETL